MRATRWGGLIAAIISIVGCVSEAWACELLKAASFEVTFENNLPLVEGSIDGAPVRMLLHTGMPHSFLLSSAADRLGRPRKRIEWLRYVGADGASYADVVRTDLLSFGGFTMKNKQLLVLSDTESDAFSYVIGQDVFSKFDVEFDLANRKVNFFVADQCEGRPLAYWAESWIEADMERPLDIPSDLGHASPRSYIEVNGRRTLAFLDSGAPTSVMTLSAARLAGVTPDDPGVEPLLPIEGGRGEIPQWSAVFQEISIGGETIRNARFRIADLMRRARLEAGMRPRMDDQVLLGADFIAAHRILISNSQRKLYFTHNGGPIFQVRYEAAVEGLEAAAAPAPGSSQ